MRAVLVQGYATPCGQRRQRIVHSRRCARHQFYGTNRRVHAGASNDDVELAVFRFTLGIPGFDDALIPRVVGVVGACLLVLNHAISGQSAGTSQTVTEVLGMLLAGMGIAAPTLQKTIEESTPGKGRKAPVENLEGSSNVFAISESLSEAQKEEAAWASFAILKNANVCGMCLYIRGEMVLCRGTLGVDIQGGNCLDLAAKEYRKMSAQGSNLFEYMESKAAMSSSEWNACGIIPSGAGGFARIPIAPLLKSDSESIGCLLLVCDRERAMSPKELAWCTSVASKLYFALQ